MYKRKKKEKTPFNINYILNLIFNFSLINIHENY